MEKPYKKVKEDNRFIPSLKWGVSTVNFMDTINKKHLTYKELDELTNKLLSYRHIVSANGTETKTNLITNVVIPKDQDFVEITFCDGTVHRIWLEYYQLPKVDSRTNTKPNLPVLSISRFLEKIMDAITQAFY